MRLLDWYIGKAVAASFFVVLLVLLSLFSFLEVVEQLDDVGQGSYTTAGAFYYVATVLPRRMLELTPVSALLGGVIALGTLARYNELVVIQAAGVSVGRIAWSVMRFAIVLMLVVAVLDEYVVSPLQQHGRERQLSAISGNAAALTNRGLWSRDSMQPNRDGSSFVNVRGVREGGVLADIDVYDFDADGRLRTFTHAAEAQIINGERWLLRDVDRKQIADTSVRVEHLASMEIDAVLSEQEIELLVQSPESMSPTELYRYVRYLQDTGQRTQRYAVALWQKISLPVTTAAMMLLSLAFVFGTLRGSSAGERIVAGALVGLGAYVGNQISVNLGLLLNINPAVSAFVPACAILALAVFLFRRRA